jgi:hypothetical protein
MSINATSVGNLSVSTDHEETEGFVRACVEDVFAHLDDQRRLSAHMTKRSWKMGWGKMEVRLDAAGGKAIGSHIVLDGRVFGIYLYLDEIVTDHQPPRCKRWRTVGEPHLLVIGQYTMGFDISETPNGSQLRVFIDYELPTRGVAKIFGRLFGRMYAKWCTRQMVQDAQRAFGAA